MLKLLRLCAAVALSLCIVGVAYGQAPNPPVCARTQQVQDAIVAATGASDCSGVTSELMGAITSLDLGGRGITELQITDFNGLDGFTTGTGPTDGLNLSSNSLRTLPAGIFDDLPDHTRINLASNSLGIIYLSMQEAHNSHIE